MDSREKVLVIEDNELMGRFLEDLLDKHGFEVSYCNNGQSALALAGMNRFDVIITDFHMPGLNGLDVTKSIRSKYPECFIVGISSDSKGGEFVEAGADWFFLKPFLTETFASFIKKRAAHIQN